MADQIKERDNKDAEESGRPVQLDPEQQGGTGEQQGGQKPQGHDQGMEEGGHEQGPQHQNR